MEGDGGGSKPQDTATNDEAAPHATATNDGADDGISNVSTPEGKSSEVEGKDNEPAPVSLTGTEEPAVSGRENPVVPDRDPPDDSETTEKTPLIPR